jgi:ProP effector
MVLMTHQYTPTQRMRDTLHKRFPQAFMAKGEIKKPLARGIREEVIAAAPDLASKYVRFAIQNYTLGRKYQAVMIEGAQRIHLDGRPAELVTASDALYARIVLARLEKRWARVDRKREEQRRQQRLEAGVAV